MYICICNEIKETDQSKYHLIGTKCGKCVSDGDDQVFDRQQIGNWRIGKAEAVTEAKN